MLGGKLRRSREELIRLVTSARAPRRFISVQKLLNARLGAPGIGTAHGTSGTAGGATGVAPVAAGHFRVTETWLRFASGT